MSHDMAKDTVELSPMVQRKRRGKVLQANTDPTQNYKSSLPPVKKRKSKIMNKPEQNELMASLDSLDFSALKTEVCIKFKEHFFAGKLKEIISKLCDAEHPLKDIIVSHHQCFIGLYKECQKSPESFLHFQFKWQQYCSAFLLNCKYAISEIGLNDSADYQISVKQELFG